MIKEFFQEVYLSYKKRNEEEGFKLRTNPVLDLLPPEFYSIDYFIEKCLTNVFYAARYNVDIQKIDLDISARLNLIKELTAYDHKIIIAYSENPSDEWLVGQINCVLENHKPPTRKIYIRYKDKSIEIYE